MNINSLSNEYSFCRNIDVLVEIPVSSMTFMYSIVCAFVQSCLSYESSQIKQLLTPPTTMIRWYEWNPIRTYYFWTWLHLSKNARYTAHEIPGFDRRCAAIVSSILYGSWLYIRSQTVWTLSIVYMPIKIHAYVLYIAPHCHMHADICISYTLTQSFTHFLSYSYPYSYYSIAVTHQFYSNLQWSNSKYQLIKSFIAELGTTGLDRRLSWDIFDYSRIWL